MDGVVHRYHPESPVVAFVDRPSPQIVIFLHGVTGGIMDCPYLPSLSSSLSSSSSPSSSSSFSSTPQTKENWGLIQPLLRSCYNQFGFFSIFSDVEDVDHLILFFDNMYSQQNDKSNEKKEKNGLNYFKNIILMGFSTGCQVALLYLQHGKFRKNIDGVILHGPVSDRFALKVEASEDLIQNHLSLAKKMINEGKKDDFMPNGALYGTPITAARYISMAEKMGAEDFFSPDLTDDEIFSQFPKRKEKEEEIGIEKRIKGLVLVMGGDEYVPKEVDQMSLFQRISDIICIKGGGEREKEKEERKLFDYFEVVEVGRAKHYCEEEKHGEELIISVVSFLNKIN